MDREFLRRFGHMARRINWFPGHMAKAKRVMDSRFAHADLVVEVRDSRAPASTANFLMRETLANKDRLLVFSKPDLADQRAVTRLRNLCHKAGQPAYFVNLSDPRQAKRIVSGLLTDMKPRFKSVGSIFVVMGMPNVGKSTLVNAVRRHAMPMASGKRRGVAKVGARAGVTRSVAPIQVAERPPIYMVDSPGIMVPNFSAEPELGFKLSLLGALPDQRVPAEDVCDYMLFKMKQLGYTEYLEKLGLPRDADYPNAQAFLEAVAMRKGKGSVWNETNTASHVLARFRKGLLGRVCLDDVADTL